LIFRSGRWGYRILITDGQLVPMLSVVGQLAPEGAIELVKLDIDPHGGL
jgi:hypothetical protein